MVELLAVIVIMGILMMIAIPAVSKQIADSRSKAFYASVNSIVRQLKTDTLDYVDECVYSLPAEERNTNNIGDLRIWIHYNEEGKILYSVGAAQIGHTTYDIDIEDFSKTETQKNTWIGGEGKDFSTEYNKMVDLRTLAAASNGQSISQYLPLRCYIENGEVIESE